MYAIFSRDHKDSASTPRKAIATYATKGEANRALRKLAKQLNPVGGTPWLSVYDAWCRYGEPTPRARLVWSLGTVDYVVDRV